MRLMLYERAAAKVVDLLYSESPGALRTFSEDVVKEEIRWQVMRDRNNYKGKKPKRAPYTGEPLAFNFEAAHALIMVQLEDAIDVDADPEPKREPKVNAEPKREPKVNAEPKREPKVNAEPKREPKVNAEPKREPRRVTKAEGKAFFAKLYKQCFGCHEKLWIGRPAACPVDEKVAHPLGTNWQEEINGEPYCAKCWKAEDELLGDMTDDHRCIGKKKKTVLDLKREVVAKANQEAIATAVANAGKKPVEKPRKRKRPKKTKTGQGKKSKVAETDEAPPKTNKTLGGWQARTLPCRQIQRKKWQVGKSLHQCFSTLPH